jgi:riboflavin kinase/FMN adenylyltransferase
MALMEGNIKKANKYLGYHFMLTGKVIKGKGLGKQIGYPTANIKIKEEYKIIPKQGSYIVKSILNKKEVYGMMNIGMNPTVNGDKQSIEVHFFDFYEDIYGKTIKIDLLERIRDEEKFESLEALKLQLVKDKDTALKFILNQNAQ